MSKPRRRKQKKQVKPELKLRQFASHRAFRPACRPSLRRRLPRFMVDTVAGAYAPADAELMIEGFGAAATRPVTLRANTLKATAEDIAAALDAAGIAHNPVSGTQTPLSCPRPRFPICGISTSTATAKSNLQSLSSMMPPLAWRSGRRGHPGHVRSPRRQDNADRRPPPRARHTSRPATMQHLPRAEKLESNLHRQGAKKRARHAHRRTRARRVLPL